MVPSERRELGRLLSRLSDATVEQVLASQDEWLHPPNIDTRRIGITGPPGAGKSTLIGQLAAKRAENAEIGVLMIDPSGPGGCGAFLGDRTRMETAAHHDRIFVRSVASRSAMDGTAPNFAELMCAMESAGFDELLVETVGVGQVASAARNLVDTLVLVLAPGTGDFVQAMKAGIIGQADVLVVNKADRTGADVLAGDLETVVRTRRTPDTVPVVIQTSSSDPESLSRLSEAIDTHQSWLRAHVSREVAARRRARYCLQSLLERCVAEICEELDPDLLQLRLDQQMRRAIGYMAERGSTAQVQERSRGA